MRKLSLLASFAPALLALSGCASTTSFVHSEAALGRVVVYRNGIAYFERTAHLETDTLRLAVPEDKVDDFLKSLTVVDAKTGEPAPIAYPTTAPTANESGLIDMKIAVNGPTRDLRLSYVTDAPSWKPSYRLVLEKDGKVGVQAWAIVDNTSGEDWQNVQLGVGSSSALSFRFDLRSVRTVQRETLRQDDLFAQAPPTGGATIGQFAYDQSRVEDRRNKVAELSDDSLKADVPPQASPAPMVPAQPPRSAAASSSTFFKSAPKRQAHPEAAPAPPPSRPLVQQADGELAATARRLQTSQKNYVIEGYADATDGDKQTASLARATLAREKLIRGGVDPGRIVAVGAGERTGKKGGVSVLEAPADRREAQAESKDHDAASKDPLAATAPGLEPIGTSHFESKARMTVPRGTSAMVSILNTETAGEVVYYFDAETARGNATFPFRAVRVRNPTDSVLEQGPVTVFGDGKFIGEGMSEPIPARSIAFVPFALDRQIMVERKDADVDHIARVITVQRGVFSTEVMHTRRATYALHNRLGERATVYVRHTVAQGYALTKAPLQREKLGAADLFRVDIEPGQKIEVVIEEATPLYKTVDIRAPGGMDLVTAFLSREAASGPLKAAMGELLRLHRDMANVEQQIGTTRDQMEEYRARMDELHAQIVTLKMVKTAGTLMQSLERKLQEMSDKVSKATIDLVGLQERLMVTRIKFQDGVADLTLEKKAEPSAVVSKN